MKQQKDFTAYLQKKSLAKATITYYIKCVDWFFERIKIEDVQVTKPDILHYLEYLKNNRKQQNISRQNSLIARCAHRTAPPPSSLALLVANNCPHSQLATVRPAD